MRSCYSSRRRVMEAVEHREPDRIPIDLGGMLSTGITAIAYNKLINYLGFNEKIYIIDTFQFLAKPSENILKFTWSDVLPILREPKKWRKFKLADGSISLVPFDFTPRRENDGSWIVEMSTGAILRMPPKGYYFDIIYHPLSKAQSINDLKDFNWDKLLLRDNISPYHETLDELAERTISLYYNTDKALILNFGGSIFEAAWSLRGFINFLLDLRRRPRLAEFIMDKLLEINKHNFKKIFNKLHGYIQIVQVGDDLGHQNGPIVSPPIYREIIKPRQLELYRYIKRGSNVKIFLHSCGAIYDFIEDFIEMGVDILNPIQVSARNMDTRRLKKEFGDEITFWGGGCDTQKVLPFGTPKQVEEEVVRRINDLREGGGFVFCQVHNIQPEVPPENIVTMYNTVHRIAWY